jgi:UDP-N-acetyl-D-galactosamine dehydrogenase
MFESYVDKKIAIVGLGYVGLPLAVEFGKLREVVGFDINSKRVGELRDRRDVTLEVTSEDLQAATYLSYTSAADDLKDCHIFIVTVPTPIDNANRPDLTPLIRASEVIGRVMPDQAIVIYESTVFPGATEEVCVPILEKISGKKFNVGFYCGYSPERINPGDRINTLTKIKKITSGSSAEAAQAVDVLYNQIIVAGTHRASSIKVAEAAKVIENTQRDLNIALVNELSIIFERLKIDTLDVLEAAGSKWNFLPFRPGLVGGHCIGVDPYYLTHKAEQVGYNPQVILAGRRINDNMARYLARNTIKLMLQNGLDVPRCRIGVLGITFKENCPDIRNSKVVDLIREFKIWGTEVVVMDSWADKHDVQEEYGIEFGVIDENNKVDALVVAVGHEEYRQLSLADLRSFCRGSKPILADVKSLYRREEADEAGFTVFRL